jgi:hypothetical protein
MKDEYDMNKPGFVDKYSIKFDKNLVQPIQITPV